MDPNYDEFSKKVMMCFAYQMSSETSEMFKPKEFRILEIHLWIFYFLMNVPNMLGRLVVNDSSHELISASNIEAKEILDNKEFRNDFYSNIKMRSKDRILLHSEFMRIAIDIIRLPEISEKYLIPKQPMLYACLISQIEKIGLNDLG